MQADILIQEIRGIIKRAVFLDIAAYLISIIVLGPTLSFALGLLLGTAVLIATLLLLKISVERMAADLGRTVPQLLAEPALAKRLDLARYAEGDLGLPTLRDIVAELAKPGRDPRKTFEAFSFAEGVHEIGDLAPGMKLPGVVTNVTAFGAFVDVGVHQDGLVHVSQLADRFVKDPNEIVKVGDRVKVTVVSVDLARNRIGLSMRSNPDLSAGRSGAPRHGGRDRAPRHDAPPPRQGRGAFGSLSDFLSSLPS